MTRLRPHLHHVVAFLRFLRYQIDQGGRYFAATTEWPRHAANVRGLDPDGGE